MILIYIVNILNRSVESLKSPGGLSRMREGTVYRALRIFVTFSMFVIFNIVVWGEGPVEECVQLGSADGTKIITETVCCKKDNKT